MVMTDEIKNETVEEEVEASGKEVEDEVKHEVLGYPDRVPNCHKGSFVISRELVQILL